LAYWAAGVLEGWIQGCGGGSEGVTPDSPQITQITPKWPKRAKRVIFGVFGVIQAKWAQMGISRPNMAIWAKYRPNIAYWAYMVLAGAEYGQIRLIWGVTPDLTLFTPFGHIWVIFDPKGSNMAKRVISGVQGPNRGIPANPGPDMAKWAKYRVNIAYWAYMVLAGAESG